MKIEDFALNIVYILEIMADDKYTVEPATNGKNNGTVKTGIMARYPESNVAVCVYLDECFEEYQKEEVTLMEAAERIHTEIMNRQSSMPDFNVEGFYDWHMMEKHIFATLVNKEWNQKELQSKPHRDILDLAVTYYLKVDGFQDGIARIQISYEHLKIWNKTEEDLFNAALANMNLADDMLFCRLDNIIPVEVFSGESQLYLLTNTETCLGAAEVINSETLDKICDQIGNQIIMFPSSIHEWLLITDNMEHKYAELGTMVREINQTTVAVDERLSDHVYQYTKGTGIKIVA